MEENNIYNILIAVCLIAILTVTVLIFTNKKAEPFTELYFENHQNLPKSITLNQNNQFSFTIHNLENKQKIYTYQVLLELDGVSKILNQNQIILEHDQTSTLPVNFKINKTFQQGKVTVKLDEQEIHFWLK